MNSRYDEKTAEIIAGMLKENTGIAMMDSGFYNGRHWQRNQDRDFDVESEAILNVRWGLEVTINLYHWLCESLVYAPKLDSMFQEWYRADDNDAWGSGCEEWVDTLHSREVYDVNPDDPSEDNYLGSFMLGGEFTTPLKPTITDNTYNQENLFSQDFIYTIFEIDESPDPDIAEGMYVILSIHGGADIRGGYTDPKIFRVHRDDYDFLDMGQRASLFCNECRTYWDTDDAYHWYHEGSSRGVQIDELTLLDSDNDTITAWYARQLHKIDGVIDYAKVEELTGESDLLVATDDHTVICPVCGRGHLIPGF